jgi:RNA polymerase sigma-70 factor (ECF subfamily)
LPPPVSLDPGVNPWDPSRVFRSSDGRGTGLDEGTIREFLGTRYPRLVGALSILCGSRAAAEDVVQEALARAWEQDERGRRIESLEAWVTRAAMNLARSRWRRMRVERRDRPASVPAPEPSADAVDVGRALRGLSGRQREVTVLRYYLQYDVAEIAATLGVSEGTVKTQLHRARTALARELGEHDLEEADDVTPR